MKTRLTLIGLVIAVAALGFWVARINSSLAEANNEIAGLNKKVATAQHDAAEARTQSMKPAVVEYVNGPTAPATEAQAAKAKVEADPKAALASAQALPAGADRDSAIMAALTALAATDPQGAWDLAQGLPDENNADRLKTLKNILTAWSAKDPAQAAALLATISIAETSSSTTNTVGAIETNWLKQDPEAASKWIETLPVGNTRDSAIKALVPIATESDPPTAFKWADTLSDPAKRGALIDGVVAQWAKADPDAATKAVMGRPNKNNGRQEALLEIIKENMPSPNANAPAP